MRRRGNQTIQASLDSLLDTMTNVVGILVIILVLTILGVDEAVSRISEQLADQDLVSQEQYDSAVEEATQVTARLEQVRSQPVLEFDLTLQQQELARLKTTLDQLKPTVTDNADAVPDPEVLTQRLQAARKNLQSLQKQLDSLTKQSTDLTKRLAVVGTPVPTEPQQITIPDPRAAPEGSEPVYFLCKGDRVVPLPLEQLFEVAEKRIEMVRRNSKSDVPPCKQLMSYFEDNEVKWRGIRIKLFLRPRSTVNRIYLRFVPDEGLGETIEEIKRSSSKYKRAMLTMKRDGNYARFIVWPDSYEAYIAARTLTDEYKLPAGWQPVGPSHVFEQWSPFTCKPEKPNPPPKPNPQPKPNPDDPKKPKPLPEPPID